MNERTQELAEMITLKEASRRTGLSYECLRMWCREGKIVHVRAGRKIFVNWGKLCEKLEIDRTKVMYENEGNEMEENEYVKWSETQCYAIIRDKIDEALRNLGGKTYADVSRAVWNDPAHVGKAVAYHENGYSLWSKNSADALDRALMLPKGKSVCEKLTKEEAGRRQTEYTKKTQIANAEKWGVGDKATVSAIKELITVQAATMREISDLHSTMKELLREIKGNTSTTKEHVRMIREHSQKLVTLWDAPKN